MSNNTTIQLSLAALQIPVEWASEALPEENRQQKFHQLYILNHIFKKKLHLFETLTNMNCQILKDFKQRQTFWWEKKEKKHTQLITKVRSKAVDNLARAVA